MNKRKLYGAVALLLIITTPLSVTAIDDADIQSEEIMDGSENDLDDNDFEEDVFEEETDIAFEDVFEDEELTESDADSRETSEETETDIETETETEEVFEAVDYGNTAKGFVYRLYKYILNREPDTKGLNDWTYKLTSGQMTGVDVAKGFINSDELKRRNLSNSAYVDMLYKAFLNRSSDSSGKAYWVGLLDSGISRNYVYKGFGDSTEFQKICKQYGIKGGTVKLTEARDQNVGVTKFVYRCYQKFLGRTADADGLNYWCKKLLNGEINAKEAAKGFVLSKEFTSKSMSSSEFIKTMYLGLFNRSYDSAGYNYWYKMLVTCGNSRESVFYGFADSKEFRDLTRSFGLYADWSTTKVNYHQDMNVIIDDYRNWIRSGCPRGSRNYVSSQLTGMSSSTTSKYKYAYAWMDFNHDGHKELLIGVSGTGSYTYYSIRQIWITQNSKLTNVYSYDYANLCQNDIIEFHSGNGGIGWTKWIKFDANNNVVVLDNVYFTKDSEFQAYQKKYPYSTTKPNWIRIQ